MWCCILNGWVKRDGSKRAYALNHKHLRLALHFRELCPAVSGETEGGNRCRWRILGSFIGVVSKSDCEDEESSKEISFMLRKGLHILVLSKSPLSMSARR